MPRTNSENATQISYRVPTPLLDEALELAEFEGWSHSEFHRICWEQGFALQSEKSNKRLVNKGLRQKVDKTHSIDAVKEASKKASEIISKAESKKNAP